MKADRHLATLLQRFFEDYLCAQRGVSQHTVFAYRDAIRLYLRFTAQHHGKEVARLRFADLTAPTVLAFLEHLERERNNGARTRNHRLTVLQRFFAYTFSLYPEQAQQCVQILAIPAKRTERRVMSYLELDEFDFLQSQVNPGTLEGRRDLALLSLLYNSGARAQEVIDLQIDSIQWVRPYQVRILGKGRRERLCPLWPETVTTLAQYLEARGLDCHSVAPLFVNQRGERLSRSGLHYLIRKYVARAARSQPAFAAKRISAHTFRHTTAMHLLQSGVELNLIWAWLGHASIETTDQYVEADLTMKRRALEACQPQARLPRRIPAWQHRQDILAWLESL